MIIKCPYCGSEDHIELKVHPYPYVRGHILTYPFHKSAQAAGADFLQHIKMLGCLNCVNHFFYEERLGSDMGLPNEIYCQVYRQGWYQYRDTSNILKKIS